MRKDVLESHRELEIEYAQLWEAVWYLTMYSATSYHSSTSHTGFSPVDNFAESRKATRMALIESLIKRMSRIKEMMTLLENL